MCYQFKFISHATMAHIKFIHIHTDCTFYPVGVETEYIGVAEFTHDGDGENVDIIELYINGEKADRIFGTDKHWTAFLDTLATAARRCNDDATQARIVMPADSVWYELSPVSTRRNMKPSFGNAVQVPLTKILKF